ncbi:MAG: hypothetical protein HVK34_03885, partial [Pelagibacteraceae bacterium]|nr:hypothetical protein [Pelagibacteraceae bacterium]
AFNNTESYKLGGKQNTVGVVQEWDNISLAYSMGGMTIGVSDSDCSNCSYTSGQSQDETVLNLTIAF